MERKTSKSSTKSQSRYYNMTYQSNYGGESQPLPTWKTYLYTLQLQAPKPKVISCSREIPLKPPFYQREYHGNITREEADRLLGQGDGSYLVRKSERAHDAYTLAISFEGQTKNFKLFNDVDGQHYVGEKRFDTVHDLVADGLIHFYVEAKASDYIAKLSNESNYAESPYLAYTAKKKRLQLSENSRKTLCRTGDFTDGEKKILNGAATVVTDDFQFLEHEELNANVHEYEKPHVFKTHNFIGLNWCDFCANFMWGLIAQGSKCQDCGFGAHKKCSEKVPNDCMPDIKFVKNLYGADLTTAVKLRNTPLPIVVTKCVKEIESRGVDAEGLYRIAGLHDEVECIRMAFDKDGENTDISEAKYDDIHSITSVLKLYFRLLPIPLITFESYKIILDAIKHCDLRSREQLTMVKEGLSKLPPAHYQTLKYLVAHFVRVTEKKPKNMMGPDNLSIVFAPTLMRNPEPDPFVSLLSAGYEQRSIEIMISCYKDLFSRISLQQSVEQRLVDHV